MFEKRTDLALETHEMHGNDSGISVFEEMKSGIRVITAEVDGEKKKQGVKHPSGKYITLEIGKIWQRDRKTRADTANAIAAELKALLPKGDGCVLVAGLGNLEITPDSLGPRVVKRLLVTRHIEIMDDVLFRDAGFASLAAIAPGVLAQTGIESAEIIKSVCAKIKPKCVIVIDALASRRMNRLATTVQLSDGGIVPGSGVSNKRSGLDASVLGVPVISVGVPMVVDAATLALDLLEAHYGREDESFFKAVEKVLAENASETFVTPKENDVIVKEAARLVATAINIAVQRMTAEEIEEYIG